MEADLLIKGGTILTFNPKAEIIQDGWLSIKGNKIGRIGKANPPKAKHTIDASGKIVMPGLINAHTHSPMVLLRGFADDLKLQDWLFNNLFPVEAKFAKEDFVYWGTKLAAAEMLLSGTTTFSDMYFERNTMCRAAKETGIRAVVAWAGMDLTNSKDPKEIVAKAETFLETYKDDELITPAVAPHSPYTCSPELLMMMAKLADEHKAIYHIHVSETKKEVDDSIKKNKKSPVKYLDSLGVLSPMVLAAHCVHLSEEDIKILKKHDVKVVHCPESNMKLSSGIAKVADLAKAGIVVALGTDGAASNNNLNMFEELRSAALLQKVSTNDPTVLPAKQALDMATIDGAKALGLEDKIGSLEEGKLADIIIVDLNLPHMQPIYNPYSNLAYSANGSEVQTVIVNGKILVKDRFLTTIDLGETLEKCNEIVDKIKQFQSKA